MDTEVNPEGETSVESRIEAALFGSDEEIRDEPQPEPVEGEEAETVEVEATADDAEVEEPQFETIYDFAEALDADPEEFLSSIKAKVKINGEESEVTLAELQAGYQKDADYRQKTAAFSQEKEQGLGQLQQQAQALQGLGDAYAQTLLGEYQAVNWEQLQRDDPEDFAVRYPAYQARLQQVQNIQQQAQQMEAYVWAQRAPIENAKLLESIPEWTDPGAAQAGKAEIAQLLQSEGADAEMFKAVNQSSLAMRLLHELVSLRKAQQKLSEPTSQKKVVTKKTAILKPGPRKSKSDKQRSRVEQLRGKLKKTGNMKDAAALLLERM